MTEQRDGIGGLVIVDAETCNVVWDWTKCSSEPKPRIIPRTDLRDLLISDLDINYSKSFSSFEILKDDGAGGAKVHFDDGSFVFCDLVVGADGSSSQVKTCLGLDNKLDTGVCTIFMFANATEAMVRSMPEHFVTRYWMVVMKDFAIFISTWLPQKKDDNPSTSSATHAQGAVNLDTVDWEQSNIAIGILGPRDKFNERLSGRVIDELSAPDLKQVFLQILTQEKADDRLYNLVQSAIEPSAQFVKFSSCTRPPDEWFESHKDIPAVLIGDALHSMPPTRGMGGNLALADAADLAERIAAAVGTNATGSITAALAGFQEEVSNRGFEMVGSSVFWARQVRIPHPYESSECCFLYISYSTSTVEEFSTTTVWKRLKLESNWRQIPGLALLIMPASRLYVAYLCRHEHRMRLGISLRVCACQDK